ncbi:MAG: cysteine protease, partial [Prevotella sp.]
MNKIFPFLLSIIFVFSLTGCRQKSKSKGETRQFVTLCRVSTTPVKNQGNSDLCWLYGMLATIESEHIMRGDSVNLSPDFVFRNILGELGTRVFLSHGKQQIALRGMSSMLVHYIEDSGLIPYDAYFNGSRKINYPVLCNKVQKLAG